MTTVGPRGRITIPVAMQRAAGIKEGDEVIIRCEKPGVITVETLQAIKDRIRAGIPADADRESYDAVAEVRALRNSED
jgi:AbrB family looped-hinge helix DNA binding protein